MTKVCLMLSLSSHHTCGFPSPPHLWLHALNVYSWSITSTNSSEKCREAPSKYSYMVLRQHSLYIYIYKLAAACGADLRTPTGFSFRSLGWLAGKRPADPVSTACKLPLPAQPPLHEARPVDSAFVGVGLNSAQGGPGAVCRAAYPSDAVGVPAVGGPGRGMVDQA